MLLETMENFHPGDMDEKVEQMHKIEHGADLKKYILTEELMRAFITPIEREDIAELCHNIDEIVDCLEDAMIRIYVSNVKTVRADAVEFARSLVRCCEATKEALAEFPSFRKSKLLKNLLKDITDMEKECDRQFIRSMRTLHTDGSDLLEIMAWKDIYVYLEKCADACEHVADTVTHVVMKNS